MLNKIKEWLFGSVSEPQEIEKNEPTMSVLYTEEDLIGKTKAQLKVIGEEEFEIKFPSSDRKAEMIARILDAQD